MGQSAPVKEIAITSDHVCLYGARKYFEQMESETETQTTCAQKKLARCCSKQGPGQRKRENATEVQNMEMVDEL